MWPIDRKEYADKRGRPNAKLAELETKRQHGAAVSDDQGRANPEERYPRRREACRLVRLSANGRIKLLSPDKPRDTLRRNLRGTT
jgi:hypothetical protein